MRVAVLPHEFGHSLMARMWGIKSDPWKITWGYGGIGDILLLLGVGEKVGPVRSSECPRVLAAALRAAGAGGWLAQHVDRPVAPLGADG